MKFTALLALILFLSSFVLAQSEKKAAYGILMDNTGSLRLQLINIKILGKAVVQKVSQRGAVSLFNFETQTDSKKPIAFVTSGTGWSQDKNEMGKYINSLETVGGQTTLFDAVSSTAKIIDAKANAEKLPEKVIVLITNSENRASRLKEKQLIKELKESGVKVFAIGLIEVLESEGSFTQQSQRSKAASFLKKITKETGGNAVFPDLEKNIKVQDLLTELFAEPSRK